MRLVSASSQNGHSFVGVTPEECVTRHEGDYPASYQCQPSKTTRQDYVAHCSTRAPSIAFKDDKGQWQRTQLSISEDVNSVTTGPLSISICAFATTISANKKVSTCWLPNAPSNATGVASDFAHVRRLVC